MPLNREITNETLLDLLKSGKSAEITAMGYSMFPSLRPGDIILVNQVKDGSMLTPGDVIVTLHNDNMILHRLVAIRHDLTGMTLFITRGDSMVACDSPSGIDQIIGIAVSYKRNGKIRMLQNKNPVYTSYLMNRILLRGFFRLRRLKNIAVHQ